MKITKLGISLRITKIATFIVDFKSSIEFKASFLATFLMVNMLGISQGDLAVFGWWNFLGLTAMATICFWSPFLILREIIIRRRKWRNKN